jgi:hypothetical protein
LGLFRYVFGKFEFIVERRAEIAPEERLIKVLGVGGAMNRSFRSAADGADSKLLFPLCGIAIMAARSESDRCVGLSVVGHSSRIDEGFVVPRCLGGEVFAHLRAVEGADDDGELGVETVVVDLAADVVADGGKGEGGVQGGEGEGEGGGFGQADVGFTEVELAVKVGLFD